MAEQAPDTNIVTVTVDSKEYTIDTREMPYFKSQASSNHDEIKHFDVAVRCVEEGFHSAFETFKTDLSRYPVLCGTLKRLGVDVLGDLSVAQIINGFKTFRFDDDKSKTASTNLAEDFVFRLLYMHYTGALGSGDRSNVFNAITYIISHRYFYNHYTRSVVRETYKTMNPTAKQLAIIDKWPVYDSDGKPLEPFVDSDDDDYGYDDYYGSDSESEAYYQRWGHY